MNYKYLTSLSTSFFTNKSSNDSSLFRVYSWNHPYQTWFVFNLFLAIGFWVSGLTIGKAYLLMKLSVSDYSELLLSIVCYLLGVFYPLLWGFLLFNSNEYSSSYPFLKRQVRSVAHLGLDTYNLKEKVGVTTLEIIDQPKSSNKCLIFSWSFLTYFLLFIIVYPALLLPVF